MNTPGGTASSMEPDKTMLGVKAMVSFGNDGSSVIGRSFKIRSISVKALRDQIRRAKISNRSRYPPNKTKKRLIKSPLMRRQLGVESPLDFLFQKSIL